MQLWQPTHICNDILTACRPFNVALLTFLKASSCLAMYDPVNLCAGDGQAYACVLINQVAHGHTMGISFSLQVAALESRACFL